MKKVVLSWSSGKDSAWALHALRSEPGVEVIGLLTTLNGAFDRVAMHAVRRELLRRQAESIGLPLLTVDLPWPCPNEAYEPLMSKACADMKAMGAEAVAFGDLYLEDVRAYRVKQLAPTGLEPVFPLWGRPTDALAREMIAGGQRARVTCVDPKKLTREFAGREFDLALLSDLPPGADPCGENGEFHSFVYESPVLRWPVRITSGEVVERDGFIFADVLPAD
ncbi:MAG TPA: ATP-binding protein [Paludibaculum sp.]|jgi:uncharacterized protein (TIGR00290 family)